jgi:hypothetical protein
VLRGGYGVAYFPGNMQSGAFMKNAPFVSAFGPVISSGTTGGQPSVLLSNGLPTPAATDYVNPSGGIIAVDTNFKATRVQQFNLMLEKEWAGNVLAAGYVGSRGDRVAQNGGGAGRDINLAPVGAGAVQPRRAFASRAPNLTTINFLSSTYHSYYNAMQMVFQRRYRGGFTFNSNYTLAHNEWTGAVPWDVTAVERYDADNDVRHRIAVLANYELPFGRSLTGAAGRLLSGWQVNAVATWQSGLPFNITNATARTNSGGNDRPSLVGDARVDSPTIGRWFNTGAFAAQPVNTVATSVVPRNYLRGPAQRRLDLSLLKDVRLTGAARVQLRVEVYNVLNTVNFANPNGALGNAAFGTINSTTNSTMGAPRQMQFAAKLLF